jgi:O-antigen/teichoic acid export membrane protein
MSQMPTGESAGVFRFARGAGIAMASRLFGRGLGYVGQVILARILQPELFGLYAIGWTILRLITVTAPLGLDNGVIRYLSKHYWNGNHSHLRGIFTLSLGGAFLSGLSYFFVFFFTANWIAVHFFQKPELELILKGFAFVFPLVTILRVLVATSSVTQKMLCGGVAEDIIQPFVQISLFVLFWKWIGGIESALVATILSFAVSVVLGRLCVKRLMPEALEPGIYTWSESGPLMRFSLTSVAAVSFGVLNLWGNRLVIGYFRPEAEVGVFQSISLIAMFTAIILSGIKAIMAPMAAELYQAGEVRQLDGLVKVVSKWILYISLPFILTILVLPQETLIFTFGESYQSGAAPLVVLMLSQIFYLVFGFSDQLLLMSDHHRDWLVISALVFLLGLGLSVIIVPLYGLIGAAWVSVVSSSATLLWGGIRIRKVLGIWPYDRRYLKPVAAAVVTLLLLIVVAQVPVGSIILKLVLAGITAVIVYGSIVLLLGLDPEDRFFLEAIKGKLGMGNAGIQKEEGGFRR